MIWVGVVAVGLALLAGLIVTGVRHSLRKTRERRDAMHDVASRLGFEFTELDKELPKRFAGFKLFSTGHTRRATNILRGRSGALDILLFDYRYTVQAGNHPQVWLQTVVLFDAQRPTLPNFSLRPENVFHKVGQAFGYQDIDFESHPEFSRRYLLRGDDERAVAAAFSPRVLDHFTRVTGRCVEAGDGRLVYWRPGKRVAPADLDGFLREAVEVYALFTV